MISTSTDDESKDLEEKVIAAAHNLVRRFAAVQPAAILVPEATLDRLLLSNALDRRMLAESMNAIDGMTRAYREGAAKSADRRRRDALDKLQAVEEMKATGRARTDSQAARIYLAESDADWPSATDDERRRKIKNFAQAISNARGKYRTD
jgi:hypothetical protein